MSTITLGGNTYNLIPLPSCPGFTDITVSMMDAVAVVSSPYVPGQAQTQVWPGADAWGLQLSLPKMQRRLAAEWIGFLASLRGMENVVQLGDPLGVDPCGVADGAPVVSGANAQSATVLNTRGWAPNIFGQLLATDYLEVGSRLYQAAAKVNSDGTGNATISIWPSLRDPLVDGAAINLRNCQGVFRLASNLRKWHATVDKLTEISFAFTEVR